MTPTTREGRAPTSEPGSTRPPVPGGHTPIPRFCGSCGAPLDDAALAGRWCPACGARITSSGDVVAEGPDEPTLQQPQDAGSGRLAPESGPTAPPSQAINSPALPSASTQRSASPSRWLIGALALAVVLALLSSLLVALTVRGDLQVVIGPYVLSHGGASAGTSNASTSGSGASASATPSPASSATPNVTPTSAGTPTPTATPSSTEAAALAVSPTSFQLVACVANQVKVTVSDSGGAPFTWSASASAAGVRITPPGGTLAAGASVPVQIAISNLASNVAVTFTAPGAQGSPQRVSISCAV